MRPRASFLSDFHTIRLLHKKRIEEGCHSRTTPTPRMTHRHRFHGTATFNMTHTESTFKIRSTYTYTYQNIHTRIQNSPHTCTHMTLKLRVGLAGRASVSSPLRCAGVPQICDNSQLHLAFASSFTGRGMATKTECSYRDRKSVV